MLSILAFCHFLLLFLIILNFFLFSFKNVLVLGSLLCIHRDCNCMLLLLKKFNKEKLIRVVLLWSSNNVKLLLHMASGIFITMCLCLVSDGIFGFHRSMTAIYSSQLNSTRLWKHYNLRLLGCKLVKKQRERERRKESC